MVFKSTSRQAYGIVATISFAVAALMFLGANSLNQDPEDDGKEITVERINIVDADGTLKMVISNSARMHPGRIAGEDLPARERPPAIIFFDEQGDEAGGLGIFGDEKGRQGGFLIDQIGNDESVRLLSQQAYTDNGFVHSAGLSVVDRNPDMNLADLMKAMQEVQSIEDAQERQAKAQELQEKGVFGADRLFVGRRGQGEVAVDLRDAKGKSRLRLTVSNEGDAKIEFLDSDGNVAKVISAE